MEWQDSMQLKAAKGFDPWPTDFWIAKSRQKLLAKARKVVAGLCYSQAEAAELTPENRDSNILAC